MIILSAIIVVITYIFIWMTTHIFIAIAGYLY